MTVAAVIVSSDAQEAVEDSAGRAAVRRIVDAAWAGGALPIVVVADDVDGAVSAVLAGSPAVLIPSSEMGGTTDYLDGSDAAQAAVQETSAALLWPARMVWVDPETVTSLIEAHGRQNDRIARPAWQGTPGWPVMLPSERISEVLSGPNTDIESALSGLVDEIRLLELGDPGSVFGREVNLEALPGYEGPLERVGGPPPEWGAAAADTPDPETSD